MYTPIPFRFLVSFFYFPPRLVIFVRILSFRSSIFLVWWQNPKTPVVLSLCECAVSSSLGPYTLFGSCLRSVVFGSVKTVTKLRINSTEMTEPWQYFLKLLQLLYNRTWWRELRQWQLSVYSNSILAALLSIAWMRTTRRYAYMYILYSFAEPVWK